MNPELKYPELKDMKSSEMFIEWAYVVRNLDKRDIINIYVHKIIAKKDRNEFVKKLENEYNAEFVNLATIIK